MTATTYSRRRFLAAAGIGGVAGAFGAISLDGMRLAFGAPEGGTAQDTLVVVFLRGAADGLSMTPPHNRPEYYSLRPTIAIPRPGEPHGALPLDSTNSNARFPSGLDGVVGLHPALAPIYDTLWTQGRLALIPAAGFPATGRTTRSHFRARSYWDHGSADRAVTSGWLARALIEQASDAALLGVTTELRMGSDLLDGPLPTLGVPNLSTFGLSGFRDRETAHRILTSFHRGDDRLAQTGDHLLSLVDRVEAIDASAGSGYPIGKLSRNFRDVANLIRSDLDLRAAVIDFGGWDHHASHGAPGNTDGRFWKQADALGRGLRAFTDDLGADLDRVTVLVLTEFGRTIGENGNKGCDHGRGTTLMAMGGGIQGGVFGYDYPDVIEDDPDEGDLHVFTDFRVVASEILRHRVGIDPAAVFPTVAGAPELGLTRITEPTADDQTTTTQEDDTATTIAETTTTATPTTIAESALPTANITDATVTEANGEVRMRFDVTLSKPSDNVVTVLFSTRAGTAKRGEDWRQKRGKFTFQPGQTAKFTRISIVGDRRPEPTEEFTVVLEGPTNATLGKAIGYGTVLDDDGTNGPPSTDEPTTTPPSPDGPPPSGLPKLRITDATVTEVDAGHNRILFVVTLDRPTDKPVTVQFGTRNGTATMGSDYVRWRGSFRFEPGQTRKTTRIKVFGDRRRERRFETFDVVLSNASNATIAKAVGVATIRDND